MTVPAYSQQDNSAIDLMKVCRSQLKSFEDSWPIGVDDDISLTDEHLDELELFLIFEVDGYAFFIAVEDVSVDGDGCGHGIISCYECHLRSLVCKVHS